MTKARVFIMVGAVLTLAACGRDTPAVPRTTPTSGQTASPGPSPAASPSPATAFTGQFRSLDPYEGSGEAQVVANPDGSRTVRFANFTVSNGPALRVYLSAAASESPGDKFDDDFVDLGLLQSTSGNQEYAVPSSVDPSRFRSVVVWCTKFRVGFTVAPIS